MPQTYCSCAMAGQQVRMEPDRARPGKYVCIGCGAPQEVVYKTQDLMSEEWTRTGVTGKVPESLLQEAILIDNEPGVGPRITPFKEPAIETRSGSGRSLKELEEKQKEITNG